MYDIIGDIHGYASKLELLLQKLGYRKKGKVFSHPERKVIFAGDYIDRGPQIWKTLSIVRNMVEKGSAIALMGNHEYNFICYNTFDPIQNKYLRAHSLPHFFQVAATQFSLKFNSNQLKSYTNWMLELPFFFDSPEFRIVHACWDNTLIDKYKQNYQQDFPDINFYRQSVLKGTFEHQFIKTILKGPELRLPKGYTNKGQDGLIRNEIRVKWWEQPNQWTYKNIAVHQGNSLPDKEVPIDELNNINFYPSNQPPVFFGHYWMKGIPQILSKNACCLDYSVARKGHLVCYRWDGEKYLSNGNLCYV